MLGMAALPERPSPSLETGRGLRAANASGPVAREEKSRLRRFISYPPLAPSLHIEANHHGVILMDHVVAVHHIMPGEIAEAEEHLDRTIRADIHHVFAARLVSSRRGAVSREDLELLVVHMDGMRPAAGLVDQRPNFGGPLFDRYGGRLEVH